MQMSSPLWSSKEELKEEAERIHREIAELPLNVRCSLLILWPNGIPPVGLPPVEQAKRRKTLETPTG